MSPKPFDERLQYHARRFQGKHPQNVLKRYEQRLHLVLNAEELQQNAFHVAAWVAELPAEQISLQYGGLSAVTLLRQYLHALHHEQILCDHLINVLRKAFERINANSDAERQWPGLLSDLRRFLPETKATKAARLMNKAIQVWRNTTCETQQEEYVALLEQSLGEVASDDTCQIRSIFRRAVAALSPPRVTSEHSGSTADGVPQPTGAKRDFQFRLRSIVLRCLDRLDLADFRLQPAVQFLKSLLGRFQELDKDTSEIKIGCRKQWCWLETKCGLFARVVSSTEDFGIKRRRKAHCPHGRLKFNCPKCSPCQHGKTRGKCEKCNPCPHGKLKWNCVDCEGCKHGRVKQNCRLCNACIHGRNKYKCPECKRAFGVAKVPF